MNNDDKNRYSSVQELQQRLQMARGPKAQLAALMEHLPQIVEASPSEAIVFAGKAERAATEVKDWNAYVAALMHRARAHMLLNNPQEAGKDLTLAREYLGDQEDNTMGVRIAMARGHALSMLGDLEQATKEYQDALGLCGPEETGLRADVLQGLADFHLSTGHYDEAIEFLRQAIGIYTELGLDAGRGEALGAVGAAYGKMDDLATSYDYHQQSLEAFRAADDVANQGRTLANLASIQQKRGELNDALDLALKGEAACEACNDWVTSGILTITIADLHARQGELDLAMQYYLKAHGLLQKQPPNDVLLGLYERIGRIHDSVNDLHAAQLVYQIAISIAEKIGERQVRSELHNALSSVFERTGHYSDALRHYRHYAQLQQELAKEEQHRKIEAMQREYDMLEIKRRLAASQSQVQELKKDIALTQRRLTDVTLRQANENSKPHDATSDGITTTDQHSRPSADDPTAMARDQEWERMKFEIDMEYPGLDDRLFRLCPTLTVTEMKICLLTKALKENSSEIARILDNTVRTLQTQRLKIRKKLGLGGDVNFVTYIDSI